MIICTWYFLSLATHRQAACLVLIGRRLALLNHLRKYMSVTFLFTDFYRRIIALFPHNCKQNGPFCLSMVICKLSSCSNVCSVRRRPNLCLCKFGLVSRLPFHFPSASVHQLNLLRFLKTNINSAAITTAAPPKT